MQIPKQARWRKSRRSIILQVRQYDAMYDEEIFRHAAKQKLLLYEPKHQPGRALEF